MKIDEKIEEMQSKLIKVVIEASSRSQEEAVQEIEKFGLPKNYATELLKAYISAKSAKDTAENVWNTALQSRSGVDFSTDIAKTQERESRTRTFFDAINAECAIIMVANAIEPNEIDNEMLDKLYEHRVREDEIKNPALRITYHYYNESKNKDNQMAFEKANASKQVDTEKANAEKQIASLNSQLQGLRGRYATLNHRYNVLQSNYESLQNDLSAAEQLYQKARAEISTLKDKIEQLQNRGIFKTIGDKLTGLFRNKRKELPEATTTEPNSTNKNSDFKMGLRLPVEEDLGVTYIGEKNVPTAKRNQSKEDDWQL